MVVLLAGPETALANGFERGMGLLLFTITVFPLILMGIGVVCAIRFSKSRFALVYYPVIGGLVAAACVSPLTRGEFLTDVFLRGAILYGFGGLVIGGLAFLIRARVARHRTKDRPTGDSKEKS